MKSWAPADSWLRWRATEALSAAYVGMNGAPCLNGPSLYHLSQTSAALCHTPRNLRELREDFLLTPTVGNDSHFCGLPGRRLAAH